jgi:hypothetical protein
LICLQFEYIMFFLLKNNIFSIRGPILLLARDLEIFGDGPG